jgi:hypothetical protein
MASGIKNEGKCNQSNENKAPFHLLIGLGRIRGRAPPSTYSPTRKQKYEKEYQNDKNNGSPHVVGVKECNETAYFLDGKDCDAEVAM